MSYFFMTLKYFPGLLHVILLDLTHSSGADQGEADVELLGWEERRGVDVSRSLQGGLFWKRLFSLQNLVFWKEMTVENHLHLR